eukprot:50149-Alexandrium_andersonii.AAC.1
MRATLTNERHVDITRIVPQCIHKKGIGASAFGLQKDTKCSIIGGVAQRADRPQMNVFAVESPVVMRFRACPLRTSAGGLGRWAVTRAYTCASARGHVHNFFHARACIGGT